MYMIYESKPGGGGGGARCGFIFYMVVTNPMLKHLKLTHR